MANCKTAAAPVATNTKLVKEDGSKPVDHTLYQSIISSLLYALTMLALAYHTVRVLCKFNATSIKTHMTAARRLLRYLKGAMEYGITFSKCNKLPVGYCDATRQKMMRPVISHLINLIRRLTVRRRNIRLIQL